MDKRIAIPAGLALMVALAVVGMLSILSFTSTQSAEASIGEISQDIGNNVALAKIEQPLKTPLDAVTVVLTAAGATINPTTPGAVTRLTVRFQTTTGVLANGSDEIIIRFDADDWADNFPTSISPSNVTISADSVTVGSGTGTSGQAVNPQDVTVELVGNENDLPEVTILVPDMDRDDGTGGNGIDAGANVTIVFSQAAGIRNPAEGGDFDLLLSTTDEPGTATQTVTVPVLVELSDVKDVRGRTVVIVAKGIKGGTATFWRDADGDRVEDAGEVRLCSANESNKIATCDYDISNPPFAPGTGTGTCALADVGTAAFNCNFISVIDGEAVVQDLTTQADIDRSTFELEGSITASPDEGNPGDTFTIQMKDFPNGDTVTRVQMGAVDICNNAGATTCTSLSLGTVSNTELDFSVEVPDGVPEGNQLLVVTSSSGADNDTDFIVGGAELIVTPETVVPNQRVSVIGTGFTDGGGITINSGSGTNCPGSSLHAATIGGTPIAAANINDGASISVDNGGNWSASIDMPVVSATTTAGPRELKITDCNGREGKILLDFLARTVTITPEQGLVGSDITIKGTNFAAKNDESPNGSPTVTITYDAGSTTTSTTATPDAGGNWTATLRVPTNASIPSTNVVTASYQNDGGSNVITTLTHRVPRAVIALDKLNGPAGTGVTITASGFKRFSPVVSLEVGNIDVTPAPKPSTDNSGTVTFSFVIPGTDTGVQTVELDVGGTTASVGFTVTDSSGGFTGARTPTADALAPLLENDTLDRAFFFNNTSKEWNFFINDDVFSSSNDLDEVVSGAPIWIKVTEDQSVDLNDVPFDLTCVNPGTPEEDCWNLIVFP